jgi:hypothetical protein
MLSKKDLFNSSDLTHDSWNNTAVDIDHIDTKFVFWIEPELTKQFLREKVSAELLPKPRLGQIESLRIGSKLLLCDKDITLPFEKAPLF